MRPGGTEALLSLLAFAGMGGFVWAANNTTAVSFDENSTNTTAVSFDANSTNTTQPAASTTAARKMIKVNVTLNGLSLNQTLGLPGRWWASVDWQTLAASTGQCPAGRYCPEGAGPPVMCKMGLYSTWVGRWTECSSSSPCWENSYCPDPGIMKPCPTNTGSKSGSTSLLDCKCNDGFECVYRKQVNLNMVLHVPLGVWLSESGKLMQAAVLQAVAESAGVGVKDVQIDQVLPYLGTTTGGGSRRLLGNNNYNNYNNNNGKDALLLRFTLHGAEKVGDAFLQDKISEILLPLPGAHKSSMRRIRFPHQRTRSVSSVHWARADRVHVKPSKIWAAKSQ